MALEKIVTGKSIAHCRRRYSTSDTFRAKTQSGLEKTAQLVGHAPRLCHER